MPCRDYEDDVRTHTIEVDRPETVRMLCEAARSLEAASLPMGRELRIWWNVHKREDQLRLEAEALKFNKEQKRQDILSKLTAEEKKILGL